MYIALLITIMCAMIIFAFILQIKSTGDTIITVCWFAAFSSVAFVCFCYSYYWSSYSPLYASDFRLPAWLAISYFGSLSGSYVYCRRKDMNSVDERAKALAVTYFIIATVIPALVIISISIRACLASSEGISVEEYCKKEYAKDMATMRTQEARRNELSRRYGRDAALQRAAHDITYEGWDKGVRSHALGIMASGGSPKYDKMKAAQDLVYSGKDKGVRSSALYRLMK